MHLLDVVAVFLVLLLVGSELSVSAFVNPSAWRLETAPQSTMLRHYAAVLGRLMPFWYAADLILLTAKTWLDRHTPDLPLLLAATIIWFLATLGSILFLVPLNNQVITATPGWQAAHRSWDRRHRVRIAALAVAAAIFTYVTVR